MQILCFSFAFAFFFLWHRYMYCESRSKVTFLDKSNYTATKVISILATGTKCLVYSLCNSTSEKTTLLRCSNQT